MELNVLIVDDDKSARNILHKYLELMDDVRISGCASSAAEAMEMLKKDVSDVIFLDINMPYEDGLEFAKKLQDKGMVCKIVFASAYSNYAHNAFLLRPIDFLVKPFSYSDVEDVLNNIREEMHREEEKMAKSRIWGYKIPEKVKFKIWKGYTFLNPDEIAYAKVNGAHTFLYLNSNERIKIYEIISTVYKELQSLGFLRVNRSVVVNEKYVASIDRNSKKCVINCNGKNIVFPLTRNSVRQFERMRTIKLG